MARGRMIDKRISKSDKIAALTLERSRTLYFMIYPHLDCEGRYTADPRDIKEDCCPRLHYSVSQVADSLIDLHNVGLIRLYEVNGKAYLEADRFEDFQPGLRKDREAPSDIPAYSGPGPERAGVPPSWSALSLRLKLSLSSSISSCPPRSKKAKSETKPLTDEKTKLIGDVVAYLNQKAEKNFGSTGKETVSLISSRIDEGATLYEFKKVIDVKVAKWKGDPKMDDYLRPSTLFRQTNFENYLNEIFPRRQRRAGERDPEWEAFNNAKREHEKIVVAKYREKLDAAWDAKDVREQDRIGGKIYEEMVAWEREYRAGQGATG